MKEEKQIYHNSFDTEFGDCEDWRNAIMKNNNWIMGYRAKCPNCSIEQDFIGYVDWRQCRICNPKKRSVNPPQSQ